MLPSVRNGVRAISAGTRSNGTYLLAAAVATPVAGRLGDMFAADGVEDPDAWRRYCRLALDALRA
jgi:hypothetical protein